MKTRILAVAMLLAVAGWGGIAGAADETDKKIEIGGRVQIEYTNYSTDCPAGMPCLLDDADLVGDSSYDEIFFRRLRPYISGTLTENWMAKIEFDFGEAQDTNEVQVKDAFFVRSGFANTTSRLTIGNAKTRFGRELLNSSSSLQLVERGFVGDHNYGVPDRALGVHWDSRVLDGKVSYGLSAGAENHDPSIYRMDFDTPVNNSSDWNEGKVVAGRVDWHPWGYQKFSQGDFKRDENRLTVGVGAFGWSNDDDNNTYTDPVSGMTINAEKVDLDKASGYEISAAYRGHGVSADAEYQIVDGDTIDPAFTGGIYRDGSTQLDKMALVAGYMFAGRPIEIVVGWDSQDADNYATAWTRTTAGVNVYFNEHDLKLQIDYQQVSNFLGMRDQDHNVVLASTQFKF